MNINRSGSMRGVVQTCLVKFQSVSRSHNRFFTDLCKSLHSCLLNYYSKTHFFSFIVIVIEDEHKRYSPTCFIIIIREQLPSPPFPSFLNVSFNIFYAKYGNVPERTYPLCNNFFLAELLFNTKKKRDTYETYLGNGSKRINSTLLLLF